MRIITLDQAYRHCRLVQPAGSPIVLTPDDEDLRDKIDQAEALVLDYVNQRRTDGETWATDVEAWSTTGSPAVLPPPQVVAAVLVQLAALWRFRGDDVDVPTREPGTLHPLAITYLHRLRDPALA